MYGVCPARPYPTRTDPLDKLGHTTANLSRSTWNGDLSRKIQVQHKCSRMKVKYGRRAHESKLWMSSRIALDWVIAKCRGSALKLQWWATIKYSVVESRYGAVGVLSNHSDRRTAGARSILYNGELSWDRKCSSARAIRPRHRNFNSERDSKSPVDFQQD